MYTYIHMYIATSINICMPVAHIAPHVERTDVGADVRRVGAYMCVCLHVSQGGYGPLQLATRPPRLARQTLSAGSGQPRPPACRRGH